MWLVRNCMKKNKQSIIFQIKKKDMKAKLIKITFIIIGLIILTFEFTIVSERNSKYMNSLNLELLEKAFADGESSGSTYEIKDTTTETEFKYIDGVLKSRSRSKVDCEGDGETPCTPSDWSDWSDWE